MYVGGYDHVGMGDSMGAVIVQGLGNVDSAVVRASPGDPTRMIRDFGNVTFDEDTMLSASVSFVEGDESVATVEPATDPVESTTPVVELADPAPVVEEVPAPVFVDVDGEDVSEEAETPDGARVLPSTGGAALVLIGAGALLMATGLLLHRAVR